MQFGLSKEQRLFRDSLDRLLSEKAELDRVRRFAENDEARAADVWEGLVDLGIPNLVIDEAHGGLGLSMFEAAIAAERLGAHVTPTPFVATAVMAPCALRLAGTDEQRKAWLPGIAAGERVVGAALTETVGAREDAGVRVEEGSLRGKALFVVDFEADAYLVADGDGRLYLVEADARGLTRRRLVTIDRTRRVGELVFEGTPAELLPGSSDPEVLARVLDAGRVILAADTLGAAQHMLREAVAYAKERKQFGRVIGSFQAVKHMCAEMAAALEPCVAMVWYAAHALDAIPEESRLTACHTKAHVSEVGTFVAKTATEVHGGVGFTDLLGLHYWFKRIGLNRQLLGGPERLREEAARLQGLVA